MLIHPSTHLPIHPIILQSITRLLCQQAAQDIPNATIPINTFWPQQKFQMHSRAKWDNPAITEPVLCWPPGLLPAGRAISATSLSKHPNQMPKPSQLAISKGKKQQLNSEHPAKAKFLTSCLRRNPLTSWRKPVLELLCPEKKKKGVY